VEYLVLLIRILEVSSSNFGPEVVIMTEVLVFFPSLSRQMPGQPLKLGHTGFLSHVVHFIITLSYCRNMRR